MSYTNKFEQPSSYQPQSWPPRRMLASRTSPTAGRSGGGLTLGKIQLRLPQHLQRSRETNPAATLAADALLAQDTSECFRRMTAGKHDVLRSGIGATHGHGVGIRRQRRPGFADPAQRNPAQRSRGSTRPSAAISSGDSRCGCKNEPKPSVPKNTGHPVAPGWQQQCAQWVAPACICGPWPITGDRRAREEKLVVIDATGRGRNSRSAPGLGLRRGLERSADGASNTQRNDARHAVGQCHADSPRSSQPEFYEETCLRQASALGALQTRLSRRLDSDRRRMGRSRAGHLAARPRAAVDRPAELPGQPPGASSTPSSSPETSSSTAGWRWARQRRIAPRG